MNHARGNWREEHHRHWFDTSHRICALLPIFSLSFSPFSFSGPRVCVRALLLLLLLLASERDEKVSVGFHLLPKAIFRELLALFFQYLALELSSFLVTSCSVVDLIFFVRTVHHE